MVVNLIKTTLAICIMQIANASVILSLAESFVDFGKNDKRKYITITNSGNEVGFVEIVPMIGNVILKSDEDNASLAKITTDVTADNYKEDLLSSHNTTLEHKEKASRKKIIISPSRIKLNPKQTRKLRVIKMSKDIKQDEIYKVICTSKSAPDNSTGDDDVGLGVKFTFGIGTNTIVVFRPDNIEGNLNVVREGKDLYYHNIGNTTVKVLDVKQCDTLGECDALENQTLFPGEITKIKLSKSLPITFNLEYPGFFEKIVSE